MCFARKTELNFANTEENIDKDVCHLKMSSDKI